MKIETKNDTAELKGKPIGKNVRLTCNPEEFEILLSLLNAGKISKSPFNDNDKNEFADKMVNQLNNIKF